MCSAVAVLPGSETLIFVGARVGSVTVIDIEKGKIQEERIHQNAVDSMSFHVPSHDMKKTFFLSASYDHTCNLMIYPGMEILFSWKFSTRVPVATFSNNGALVHLSHEKSLQTRSVATGAVVSETLFEDPFRGLAALSRLPWEDVGSLRALCMTQAANTRTLSLAKLPRHLQDEVLGYRID
eukprot:TRINITY_DN5206_c0_g1_i2.p1 TRINITY_DN5206_c0_g1~~TRINITY_DN5206_c0_g1_i2.p1  ORF type:complete len:181 (+),score=42.62 TRINITY_DN5206_c0_g1_i2:565-1107(+)